MGSAKIVNNRERDWVQEMEEAKIVTSMPMQFYVNKMGAKNEFTAAEVAGIFGLVTTDPVYAAVDSGELEGFNRGSKTKRYYIFPRPCVLRFLQKRCKGA